MNAARATRASPWRVRYRTTSPPAPTFRSTAPSSRGRRPARPRPSRDRRSASHRQRRKMASSFSLRRRFVEEAEDVLDAAVAEDRHVEPDDGGGRAGEARAPREPRLVVMAVDGAVELEDDARV